MTRKFSRNYSLSVVVPFIAILILLIAAAVLAQAPIADWRSAQNAAVSAQQGGAPQAPQVSAIKFAPAVTYYPGMGEPQSVALGDLKGDGVLDLVVAGGDFVGVLLGNGNGTFQPAVTYSTGGYLAYSVAVGDVNGDGQADLVVANADSNSIGVLLGNGDGTFQPAVTYYSGGGWPDSVVIADVNGDGKPDVVVANNFDSLGVLLNNGDGTFQPVVTYASGGLYPESVAVADVNGDGYLDLVAANSYAPSGSGSAVGVLLGNGDGTFQPAVTYSTGSSFAASIAVGDLNGDGKPDLVVANDAAKGSISVLLGNGDGTFQAAVLYKSGWGADSVVIGDVNGDGKPDLIVADCGGACSDRAKGDGVVRIYLGNGDGTFQAPRRCNSGGTYADSVAIGDVNGDGRPDVVVTNGNYNGNSSSAGVLLNLTQSLSATTVTSSPNPSQVNQPVQFTATVVSSRSVPNGSAVTFYRGKFEIGTGTTTDGVATLTTSFSKADVYVIKATYAGGGFLKGSSGRVRQLVQ